VPIIQVPPYGQLWYTAQCPRCASPLIDAAFDVYRDEDVLGASLASTPNPVTGCIAVLLSIVTLGAWLVVWGVWSIVVDSANAKNLAAMKARAKLAAPRCLRLTCRACGLVYYPDEIRQIKAQAKEAKS
jgi:hypothetical protein